MHDISQQSAGRRLGFMIPMILFVLFFVICCGTMVGLFLRSVDISNRAGQVNDAVQICRNQAERIRSGELMPEKCYFDGSYHETDRENAKYYAVFAFEKESRPRGDLLSAEISVYSMTDELLYKLDTAVYAPEGR